LIGNKTDLDFARKISTQEGIDLAAKEALNFMETSALSGNNVQRAFQIVLQDIHALAEKKLTSEKKPVVNLVSDKETIHLDTSTSSKQEDSSCCGGGSSTPAATPRSQEDESFFPSFASIFGSSST